MNDKKLVENKKPIEEVQEIENKESFDKGDQIDNHLTWEEQLQAEEQEIFENFIYEAEVAGATETAEPFPYELAPAFRKAPALFLIEIKCQGCFLTESGNSFWLFQEQTPVLRLNSREGAEQFLTELENEEMKIVNNWGWETEKTNRLKSKLVGGLKEVIKRHKKGEEIKYWIELNN